MNIPPNKKYAVYVNLQGNLEFQFGLFCSLDKEPVDSEAISKSRKTTDSVTNNLDNCNFDDLLSKLNSDPVKIMSCFSPIDDVCFLYSEKHLKPPEKKNVIYISLCDGVHFQGYIVNIKEHKIIQISSLLWNQPKNPTSFQIAKMLFENSKLAFESLFSERKQFDANSCGVWFAAGMSSYWINLREISDG